MLEQFEKAKTLIDKSRRILISGHLSPDGDSLGSMIAMARMLTAAGHEAYASADVNALGKPRFLEGVADIIPVRKLKRRKFDLFIAVDCAAFERMPAEIRPVAEKLPKICIDHHVTNDGTFGDAQMVDATASSAAELVWRFAKWMEWPLDRAIAEALWVGMITDTGRFAYDSTKPETLRAASDLLRHGVRTALINDIIYGTFPNKAIALKRLAWRSLHIWKNRRVAEVSLTRDDFRSVRGTKAEAEDIIEIPRSVARNEIALFFYQIPDRTKETRCSIRTRGDWDATVLAAKFGGGGHRKAAGCTIKGTMGVAKRQMRKAVKDMLKCKSPAAKAEAAKTEAAKAEAAKAEAAKVEAAAEKAAKVEPPKPAPAAKIEVPKVAPAAKAEQPKPAPAAKTEAPKAAPAAKAEPPKPAAAAKQESPKLAAPAAKPESPKPAAAAEKPEPAKPAPQPEGEAPKGAQQGKAQQTAQAAPPPAPESAS